MIATWICGKFRRLAVGLWFEGNIFYSSEKCLPVKKEQIITAKRKTVLLSDEQTILRSHEVSGGGVWYKDISDILKLNRNLEDVGDVLVEESHAGGSNQII